MNAPTPITLGKIPPGVVTLKDHETLARTRLSDAVWAYFNGGAGDEHTIAANLDGWRQLELQPRILRSVAGGHTRVELLGQTLAHPILLAPIAYQRLAHPDGELASAHAAAAQETGFVLSTQASTRLETVAEAIRQQPTRGPLWFQLYFQEDREHTRALVERAEQAGYEALVLTVDAPCNGARDRERRAGFQLPEGIRAVNLEALPPAPPRKLRPGQSQVFDHLMSHAPTWSDIEWLQGNTRLPILLKGVTHPDDAQLAALRGISGIIVSNHGGRTLDTQPATAVLLPRIAAALGSLGSQRKTALLVDGGIRRGTDVLKAIALGADAVLIGRPYIYGLANAGALGVAHVLRLLRDELEIAMALTGCATLEEAPTRLFNANGR